MVWASGGGGESVCDVELARLEAEWAALMAAVASREQALVAHGPLDSGGAGLRAAEKAVREHERRAKALQDRIAELAAGRDDEPVILARLLRRLGEQRAWALEDLPPALVRRLIDVVAVQSTR